MKSRLIFGQTAFFMAILFSGRLDKTTAAG